MRGYILPENAVRNGAMWMLPRLVMLQAYVPSGVFLVVTPIMYHTNFNVLEMGEHKKLIHQKTPPLLLAVVGFLI
jgi:hypothetical protein